MKLDFRKFNSTLDEYAKIHRNRTMPEIVNKKALFISRGAIRETNRPSKSDIQNGLGKVVYDIARTKSGRGKRVLSLGKNSAPIAAMLINFRRGKMGKPGLFGDEMNQAIKRLVGKAQSARAFLASGWIPAVKKLSPLVRGKFGQPANDSEANKISNPHGDATAATSGGSESVAKILNDSLSKFTTTPKGEVYNKGVKGLQKAIDRETISMKENIEDEMRKAAHGIGIKTN